jgi:hypothetical protein
MFKLRSSKLFIAMLIVVILATSAYAFAASNTVPASNAGEGQTAIGGYVVTPGTVTYTYSTANPSQISSVGFTIAPAAKKASVSLVVGGTLQACTGTGGGPTWTAWTCAITGVSVLNADMLRVVASD